MGGSKNVKHVKEFLDGIKDEHFENWSTKQYTIVNNYKIGMRLDHQGVSWHCHTKSFQYWLHNRWTKMALTVSGFNHFRKASHETLVLPEAVTISLEPTWPMARLQLMSRRRWSRAQRKRAQWSTLVKEIQLGRREIEVREKQAEVWAGIHFIVS